MQNTAVSNRSRSASIVAPFGSAVVMSTADFDRVAPSPAPPSHRRIRGTTHLAAKSRFELAAADPKKRPERHRAPASRRILSPGLRPRPRTAPPVRGNQIGAGQVEVDPPPDQSGRESPERNVIDQPPRTPDRLPATDRDRDRENQRDHIHQAVDVDFEWAELETAGGRTGDLGEHRAGLSRIGC